MRAVRFDRMGSLDGLAVVETACPSIEPGEVLVQLHAAGVNPSDVENVLGAFEQTIVPRTPGRDFAGVVVDGPHPLIGKPVWGSGSELGITRDGSHAEYLLVPAAGVSVMPQRLSFTEAAACAMPYLTAYEAVTRTAIGRDSKVVLIGMGAVGRAFHALTRARRATILVGVRRGEQVAALRSEGVDAHEIGDTAGFVEVVAERFGPGAQVAFDSTGHHLSTMVRVLAPRGTGVVISAPPDRHDRMPVVDFYRRSATLIGVNTAACDSVANAGVLHRLGRLFDSGLLTPPTRIQCRTLDSAVETYREVRSSAPTKFVLELR